MRLLSIILSGLVATVISNAAHASLLVSGVVGGARIGVVTENFDNLIPGNITTTALPSGITISYQPDAKPVSGSNSLYAAPFLSGGNGLGFGPGGSSQAIGADLTTYITTGSTGAFSASSVTLQLPGLERYFGILWGSVDDYNTLSFYNGATLVGAITGNAGISSPDGDQGVDGTLYVNIDATAGTAFDRVVATSSQYAFEFDNVAFSKDAVPEPVSLGLLGTGVLGLLLVKRRRAAFSG